MSFEGKVEVRYTKNGNEYVIDVFDDDIIDTVIDHTKEHLRVQHPDINTEFIHYEASEPDYLAEIMSATPQEPIQIPSKEFQLNGVTYVATFGPLEFTEQNNNQIGGRRRYKLRSRRAHKTSKRKVQRKRSKTHRRKRNSRK